MLIQFLQLLVLLSELVAVIKESAACILMASYLTSSASGVFLIYMISTLER